jgi:hypothetical protein
MRLYYSIALCFLIQISYPTLFAQALDSNFIQIFDTEGRLNTGLLYKDLEVRFFSSGQDAFVFRNTSLGLSLGGRLGKIRFSFTIPIADLNTSSANSGKSFGLNLQFYRPRYYYEIGGQRLTGFRPETGDEAFRRDVRLWDFTLQGFKIYNPRLSLRAAFKNNQRQKASQGSWLSALILNTQFLYTDSITIQQNGEPDLIIDRYQHFEWGLMGGYAYTFLLSKDWYFTPLVVAGPEFRLLNYRLLHAGSNRQLFRVAPRFRARLAFGYNSEKLFSSVSVYLLPGFASKKRLNTRIQDNQVRFQVGFRF